MKIAIKILKIVIGLLFGLSSISLLSQIPDFGFTKSVWIGVFQAFVSIFLFYSAFRKKPTANANIEENQKFDPTMDEISDKEVDDFLSQITNKIESVSNKYDEQTVSDAINKVTKKKEKEYFIEMKFSFTWEEARKYVSDHMAKKGVLKESSNVFWENASRDERIEDLTDANTFDVLSNLEPHQVIVEANRTIHTAQEPETISFVYTIGKSA